MRENPDEIDHFMQYSDASRILETIYPRILKKMVINSLFRALRVLLSLRALTRRSGNSASFILIGRNLESSLNYDKFYNILLHKIILLRFASLDMRVFGSMQLQLCVTQRGDSSEIA